MLNVKKKLLEQTTQLYLFPRACSCGGVGGHYPLGQSYRYGERGTQPAGCWPKNGITAAAANPRGYQDGAFEMLRAIERFLDPLTRDVVRAWIEQDINGWRLKAMLDHPPTWRLTELNALKSK